MSVEKKTIEFKEYQSIDHDGRKRFMDELRKSDLVKPNVKWVATEKVHGVNFSMATDGSVIRCFRRSGPLEPEESFNNFQIVLEDEKARVLKAFQLLKEKYPDATEVHIFGELFGGGYPHNSVPKVGNYKVIQKGVYYSPKNLFYAFDISINRKGFLDFEDAEEIFKKCGFLYAVPLANGTFEELLAFDVENFQSTIPKALGLPLIDENYAEGIVLKPLKDAYLPEGERAILKKKRSTFSEVAEGKVDVPAPQPKEKAVDVQLQATVAKVFAYVTENRLRNVLSKIGQIDRKQTNKLISLTTTDAVEDFRKDNEEEFGALDQNKVKEVNKQVTRVVAELVKKHMEAIVAGEF